MKDKYYNKALNYLSYKARTKQEVYNYLLEKEATDEQAQLVLKKLIYYNMVNDEVYTNSYIITQKLNNKSPKKIKNELITRGVSIIIIENVIEKLYTIEDELSVATKQMEKFLRTAKAAPFNQIKNKVYNKLLSQGFSSTTINQCIEELNNNLELNSWLKENETKIKDTALQIGYKYYDKYRKKKNINTYKIKGNIYNTLLRKGYATELCREVIEEIFT
ncbi:RecX family transcriptional regulator [Serpentinicella sp. ANB-PHB4]|uniref:regulatory protein RecX n=1 Tax=Serpentinicella sp. ANB-PHB4 TaxID=3074076 RepID=UPI002854337A|nr:RecX family transcriptional regulator [Serpentinicella sp. ANB-PHB4]MDR5658178.1 RecX family transcriptional regulator [Serpentinicella sp. ANB-PHB4]